MAIAVGSIVTIALGFMESAGRLQQFNYGVVQDVTTGPPALASVLWADSEQPVLMADLDQLLLKEVLTATQTFQPGELVSRDHSMAIGEGMGPNAQALGGMVLRCVTIDETVWVLYRDGRGRVIAAPLAAVHSQNAPGV